MEGFKEKEVIYQRIVMYLIIECKESKGHWHHNVEKAKRRLRKFNDTFKLLCSHPNMGFIKDEFKYKNVRFYKVKKHYLIAYNFENDEINILRVLSSYQDIIDKL